jgi:hypothetical protein
MLAISWLGLLVIVGGISAFRCWEHARVPADDELFRFLCERHGVKYAAFIHRGIPSTVEYLLPSARERLLVQLESAHRESYGPFNGWRIWLEEESIDLAGIASLTDDPYVPPESLHVFREGGRGVVFYIEELPRVISEDACDPFVRYSSMRMEPVGFWARLRERLGAN